MRVPTVFAARTAIILVAGSLLAPLAWSAPSLSDVDRRPRSRGSSSVLDSVVKQTFSPRFSSADQTPKPAALVPPASSGSCEDVAARQASAYLARLKAKEYAAASEIARKAADLCLEAGDLKRAARWFQTARAVGPRKSNSTAERDAQFRRRYQQAAARPHPRQDDVAAAEARMAARRASDRGTDPGQNVRSAASKTSAAAAPPFSGVNRQSGLARFSWIAAASGVGLFALGAVLLRRRGAAVRHRNDRMNGRGQRRRRRQAHA